MRLPRRSRARAWSRYDPPLEGLNRKRILGLERNRQFLYENIQGRFDAFLAQQDVTFGIHQEKYDTVDIKQDL